MSLRDYWRVVVQRGWIVVVALLLTAGSAYLWSATRPPEYRATTMIQAGARSLDWGRLQALKQRLGGYPQKIRSPEFAFQVVDRLRLDRNPYELLNDVAVSVQINELVIQIDATDRDPESAGAIANAFAESFDAYIQAENAEQLREDQIELSVLQSAGAGGRVGADPLLNAIAGGLLGLFLGALIVLVLELVDDTIKSREDIERVLGEDLRLLGQVPPGQRDLAPPTAARR